jgi:glycosyltransferase involved in cell wall biosynthesis
MIMKNKIRLVMVEQNGSGGLIHYAYQLCTALQNAGLDVTLITGKNYELAHLPHNFSIEDTLDLWPLFELKSAEDGHESSWKKRWQKIQWTIRRGMRALRLIYTWMKLTSYLIKLKPDLVQFSKINFPFEALFLAHMERRGLILTQICHEFELRESTGMFSALILKTYSDIYKHFSIMFFHARENRDRFLQIFPFVSHERTRIIAHGNSGWLLGMKSDDVKILREKYGLQDDERVVLFFGLLAPSKGLDDLIDAFALVRKNSQAKLVIAGYPTKYIDMGELEAGIAGRGLQQDVIFDARYIPLEQIRPLMELAIVVIYPYISSTQSGALQVAYTFGRPVIATRVGGLPEVVDDSQSGFLVPVHSPRDLADKITLLVNDAERARQMGEYAYHLSETRFNWDTIAGEMRPVYEQLLSKVRQDDND